MGVARQSGLCRTKSSACVLRSNRRKKMPISRARNRGGPATAATIPTITAHGISSGESRKETENAGIHIDGRGRKPSSIVELLRNNDDNDEEKLVCPNTISSLPTHFTERFSAHFSYTLGVPKTCSNQRQRDRCKVHVPTKPQYHFGLHVSSSLPTTIDIISRDGTDTIHRATLHIVPFSFFFT